MSNLRPITRSVNPANSGENPRSPKCITWGPDLSATLFNSIDTMHLGFHVHFPEHPLFFESLEEGKNEALTVDKPVPFKIGMADYVIYPTGRKGGYRWHIASGDIHLFFSVRDPGGETPNVYVEIGSMPCWSPGHHEVIASLVDQLEEVGGKVYKIRVSRVDLAVDSVGLDFSKTRASNRYCWIKQARNFSLRGSGIAYNSMDIGMGGRIALRIYNKTQELKNNKAKQDFFLKVWGIEDPETPVTRTEFEVKKKALKEFGIETYQHFLKKLPGLWQYLTDKWFRLSDKPVNRTHQSEAKLSPWWEIIQGIKWPGIMKTLKRIRHPRRSIEMLLQQSAGIALSIGVINQFAPDDLDRFIYHFHGLIEAKLKQMAEKKKDFLSRIDRKYAEIWTTERICPV